jgi:hypothetical protein
MNAAIKVLIMITLTAHLGILLQNTRTLRTSDATLDHTTTIDLPAKNTGGATWDFSPPFSSNESIGVPPPLAAKPSARPLNALDLKTFYPTISLAELVNTEPDPECARPGPPNRALVDSTIIVDTSITHPPNRKIPNIIHVTAKTRCMPLGVRNNLDLWRFANFSFYVHDDAAVDKLLWETYWPEFPHLNLLRPCMVSGAAKADLWRYVFNSNRRFLSAQRIILPPCISWMPGIDP